MLAERNLRLLCWQECHYATVPACEQKRQEAFCQPKWTKDKDEAEMIIAEKSEEQERWERNNPYACLSEMPETTDVLCMAQ